MSARTIPPRPSLEFDRKHAKVLLDAARDGDPAALARFHAHHPRFQAGEARDAALHDAQLVIAREYGFASWPRWKQFVEARLLDAAGRAAELVKAAVTGDMRKASTLLGAEPDLAEHDLYTACVTGAVAAAERALVLDPEAARHRGGPLDREPILYACFSRFLRTDRARAAGIVAIVRRLLDRGADPNVHFLHEEDGESWVQTPIYGAAGIANNVELTRMLLAAGADVNEGRSERGDSDETNMDSAGTEALYHSTEFGDLTCLRLLLEARPHQRRVSYALARMLNFENPDGVALFLQHGADPNLRVPWMHRRTHLHRAIVQGRGLPIVRLLVEAGGDVNARDDRGITPLGYAERHGRDDVVALLGAAGADEALVSEEDRAAGAAARGSGLRGAAVDPDLLCNAACRNDAEEIRRLIAAGANPNAKGGQDETAPLDWACWRGQYEAAKALIEAGADIHTLNRYDADALDMVTHGSLHCHDRFGGVSMKLPEEIPDGDYPRLVELLIASGARRRKRLYGSEAVQEVQRRHGVPDAV
jgi:ankyrin repeat protein